MRDKTVICCDSDNNKFDICGRVSRIYFLGGSSNKGWTVVCCILVYEDLHANVWKFFPLGESDTGSLLNSHSV